MAYVIGDDCIACGTCIGECPVEAISEGEKYSINPDLCTECGTCASVCPQEAISLGEEGFTTEISRRQIAAPGACVLPPFRFSLPKL